MFSRRTIVIVLALVCTLALAAGVIVQAQNAQRQGQADRQPQPGMRPGADTAPCPVRAFGPPPAAQMQMIAAQLQLTDEQRKQATELVGALDARIKAITGDRALMKDLLAELKSEQTSADKVKDIGRQMSKQEADILQAELEMWLKFEQILTPQQQTKFWTAFPFRGGGPVRPPMGGPGMPGGPPAPGSPGEPPAPPDGG